MMKNQNTPHCHKLARLLAILIFVFCLSSSRVVAQTPVTVKLHPHSRGTAIPPDFLGLSFGMRTLLPDSSEGHLFSPTNHPLITLFQNLELKHLRVGGTTVESPTDIPIPDHHDIDNLFAFARAAEVDKIIYSLRLLETNTTQHYPETDAAIAQYIWAHYRSQLDSFALGNEPDLRRVYLHDIVITNFATYLREWRQFASTITNVVPEAGFAGPDAASANISWTTAFSHAQKKSGLIRAVTEHFYVGGAGRDLAPQKAIDDMLSTNWTGTNQRLYDKMAKPVLADGLTYRFTEANDHYSGGAHDASDTFAGALWALDFLHWWAAHGTRGVNFHNTTWVPNDVITRDPDKKFATNPKGYGLKAFALGSHGVTERVTVSPKSKLNLTAYAVRGVEERFVTIINKEHGLNARAATVTISGSKSAEPASVIYLSVPNSDVAAKTGMTLGGASIGSDIPWSGQWQSLPVAKADSYMVLVPAASAAIVRIPLPKN